MELLTKCNDSLYNSIFSLPGKNVFHKICRAIYEPKLFQCNNIQIIWNCHILYTLDKPNAFKIKKHPYDDLRYIPQTFNGITVRYIAIDRKHYSFTPL